LGFYCPVKSTFPTALTSGYYAVTALNTSTGTQGVAERVCEKGYYCSRGNRTECPSRSSCPEGSSAPAVCPKGTYTDLPRQAECKECEAGHVCSDGERRFCSRGSYCPPGSFAPKLCQSGTYCPIGTASPNSCAAGAKCTIPASPELVLKPDIFDLVESEVIKSIQYNLSLSAKPNAFVTVKLELDIENKECYTYKPKFELGRRKLEFHPDDYNIPQVVTILVDRLNPSRYEGIYKN
jgi:hypothetical protein